MGAPILELFAKFSVDSSEVDKSIDDAKGKFNGFASFLSGVGKVTAAAFAAAGAATVALGKQAVNAYANYEQLKGGIDKLYGDSANVVMQYAENAYKTSGKSMNEYMSSVSQISASLKRSIGDDMNEVARVADIAMQVISDNVNTFGSDTEAVENAIMGLSRNNYTMIDNLKLGYAGTAQGMLELINDSGVLGKTLTDTSELAEVGFDKMVLAIQKVQEQNGIAGTTAKEALFTIEGSANATKSAWQNVITAIGRGEGIEDAFGGLTTALFGNGEEGSGFLANIIPRIQKTMEGIGEFLTKAGPILAEKVIEIGNAILPSLLTTVTALATSLLTFLAQELPQMLPQLLETIIPLIWSLLDFLIESLPEMLPAFIEIIIGMVDMLTSEEALTNLIDAAIQIIMALATGLIEALPTLTKSVVDIILNIVKAIINNLPLLIESGIQLIVSLITGIIGMVPELLRLFIEMGADIIDSLRNIDWLELGKNIIMGIVNGIKSLASAIGDALMNIVKGAWNSIKKFFGIKSPSRLMRDTIGKFIPLGMAEGIEDEADSVYDAMDKLSKGTLGSVDDIFGNIGSPNLSSGGRNVNYGGLVFNIYGAEGQSVDDIAEAVKEIIVNEEERNKLVYA